MFADTGAFVARILSHDEHHAEALLAWAAVERAGDVRFVVTDAIIAETAAVLFRRSHALTRNLRLAHDVAAAEVRRILASRLIQIESIDTGDRTAAAEEFAAAQDPKLGFVDCTSFAVMRRRGIPIAFTFDRRHFGAAGFDIFPG